jgi:HK97 gp10 family phage protein
MLGGVEIKGGKELDAALQTLDKKVARKVVSASLRVGAKLVQAGAMANAPVLAVARGGKHPRTPGALRNAIKVRAARKNDKGTVAIFVGPGKKWFVGDQFYAAFQEFGWKAGARSSSKGGPGFGKDAHLNDRRRKIPGEHYVEYAFEELADAAVASIVDAAQKLIEEAVAESKSPVT